MAANGGDSFGCKEKKVDGSLSIRQETGTAVGHLGGQNGELALLGPI